MDAVFADMSSRAVRPTQGCIRTSGGTVFLESLWELGFGKLYLS